MALAAIGTRKSVCIENDDDPHTANNHASADCNLEKKVDRNNELFGTGSSSFKKRPLNLQDLIIGEENLICDTTEANFSLENISENEEIWVLDIPKMINPKEFKGQTIQLGKKNNFQIGNELYETSSVTSNDEEHLSFVFNTGRRKRPYKTVNVRPAGSIRIRQKLTSVLDVSLISQEKACVPFPKNLKLRHPLLGHDYNEKLITVAK